MSNEGDSDDYKHDVANDQQNFMNLLSNSSSDQSDGGDELDEDGNPKKKSNKFKKAAGKIMGEVKKKRAKFINESRKKEEESDEEPQQYGYEFPENDPIYQYAQIQKGNPGKLITEKDIIKPQQRSNIMQYLLMCMHLKDQIKVVTDMAFDTLDDDGSGGLDQGEISELMKDVAVNMGVTPPTDEDLKSILQELDDDYDGVVDKSEFIQLVMLVIGKMLESEEQQMTQLNEQLYQQMVTQVKNSLDPTKNNND